MTDADTPTPSGLDHPRVAHRIGDPCPMGALPRPEVPPGPHRELVDVLHDLHHRAGWPSLRRLAEQTGVSHTTVSKALSSPALPSWGTIELLVEVMGGDVPQARELWLAASAPSSGPGTERGATRIAGRVAELRVVRHHLTSGTGLLLVTGEAGIGKSALVGAAAASTDVFVAVGRCLHLSREMPLMPVADALRAVLEHDGRWMAEALAACPTFVATSLARLLPELDDRSGARAPDDLWGLERLFASVASTLRALAEARPLAVHLEDVHWADRSTLDLLTHIINSSSGPPIVATWRVDDPDVSDGHTDWLTRARWTDRVTAVDVPPLTPAETAEQLRLLTGHRGADDLARRIHPRSRGLPLYTAQLAVSPDDAALPRALADLLDRRIGDLDDVSWRVVRVLGVAQRAMPPAMLRGATGVPQDAMDEALHLLARRRLLRSGTATTSSSPTRSSWRPSRDGWCRVRPRRCTHASPRRSTARPPPSRPRSPTTGWLPDAPTKRSPRGSMRPSWRAPASPSRRSSPRGCGCWPCGTRATRPTTWTCGRCS